MLTKQMNKLPNGYMNDSAIIFGQDEMKLLKVDPEWSQEYLLSQQGIFFLKDVARKLGVKPSILKESARLLELEGEDPWEVMGIRKTWTHWQVRMTTFSTYYLTHRPARRVEAHWDANTLLSQKGAFKLTDVCEKIPFLPHQIRYRARCCADPKEEYGVYKDKHYLVDMEKFGPWIRRVWSEI